MGSSFEYRPRIDLARIWLAEWGEWAVVYDGTWIVRDAFGHFERMTDEKFRHSFHKIEERDAPLREMKTITLPGSEWDSYEFHMESKDFWLGHNGFPDEAATARWKELTKGYDTVILDHTK